MRLDFATPADLGAILALIEEASRWLKVRGKDQWAEPWPDRERRDARILKGLINRKTVIVRQGDTAVATVTMANWHNPNVWVSEFCTTDLTERAVYLHRLITARKYAGRGLGELLINWAEKCARAKYGAKRTRIDVWTTNTDLHRYYQKLGFESCGRCPDPSYPSGALFQKAVAGMIRMDGIIPVQGECADVEEGSMANSMYRQIAEDLREQIDSGTLKEGQQL
jgi:GNAT superfamily N-acetyltransferase